MKDTMLGEPNKKARMDIPNFAVPADAAFTIETTVAVEVASSVKVPPTVKAPPTVKVAGSSMLPSPSTEAQISEDPSQGEKGAEKKRAKEAVRKSRCKVCRDGPNSFDEELGENPFHNHKIIRDLVDGFTIPKVVDPIVDMDVD
ncbi:putative ensconsin-like [Cocos nucifera]|nr:putative ensconsin-like [Cocos nucifera]